MGAVVVVAIDLPVVVLPMAADRLAIVRRGSHPRPDAGRGLEVIGHGHGIEVEIAHAILWTCVGRVLLG